MSNRLSILKETLRRERVGLVAELQAKLGEAAEIERTIAALDAVIGGGGAAAPSARSGGSRWAAQGETAHARMQREKEELRRAILEALQSAPDGYTSEDLAQQVAQVVQTEKPLSAIRITHLCRWMEERGEGIVGGPDGWIYVEQQEPTES